MVAAIVLVAAACSPSDEGADTTSTSPSTTSTTTPATTVTSVAPTTTSEPSTTTTLSPSSTTTLSPSTTTTEFVPLGVELTDEGVGAGSTWLPFGTDADDTVAALTTALGPPSNDTGWLDSLTEGWENFGVCPQPRVRGVSWGEGAVSLQVLFTDGDTDFWVGGVEHFFAYYYLDSSAPTGLTTPEGIGVGSSLGDLKAAYDPAKIVIEEAFFDPGVGYWSYDMQTWTGMWGFASGQADDDTITSINGGQGCGE